jgi:hypothetical protein
MNSMVSMEGYFQKHSKSHPALSNPERLVARFAAAKIEQQILIHTIADIPRIHDCFCSAPLIFIANYPNE